MSEQPLLRLGEIGQIAIAAHDIERMTAFYRDQLGLRFLFEVPGRMSFFDCAGVRLMLSLPEPAFDHPPSTLYFRVADIGYAHRELRARGVAFVDEPHVVAELGTHELWMAFFRDPERATHALMAEVPKREDSN
jgi:catechol 2,3-dioxygenase-like lactoylglutathione lyase family enzyme